MVQLRIRTIRTGIGVGLVAIALLGACDRRSKPFVPIEEEPAKQERVSVPGLENPTPRTTMPRPMSSAAKVAEAAAGGPEIRGTIRLADGVQPRAGVLFVIARGAAGPPLAVRKLESGAFPVEFAIGASDVMIPGRRFEGDIALSARLDGDGNPMTRDPGDLAGSVAAPVQPGATDVEIVLKRGES